MILRRCSKYGGKRAIGKAKHMEARNAIIPIFDRVADNFEIPCEPFFLFWKREEPSLTVDPSSSAFFEEVRTKEPVRDESWHCCWWWRFRRMVLTWKSRFTFLSIFGSDAVVAVKPLTTDAVANIIKDITAILEASRHFRLLPSRLVIVADFIFSWTRIIVSNDFFYMNFRASNRDISFVGVIILSLQWNGYDLWCCYWLTRVSVTLETRKVDGAGLLCTQLQADDDCEITSRFTEGAP